MYNFVFGACKNGHNLKKIIECSSDYKIDYYVDNNEKKQGILMDGIKVISFEEMKLLCDQESNSQIFIALINPESVTDQIRENNIAANVYIMSYKYIKRQSSQDDILLNDALIQIDYSKHRLDYLEVHVAHHCNLRCKGCGHLSNIVPKEFPDLNQFKKDLMQLKKYFYGIKMFHLLGGEPLLNPELPEYIIATRKAFPDADIRVVSNGLLIPTLEDYVLDVMKRYCVEFDISFYHPTKNIKEKIEIKLIEHEVGYYISDEIDEFMRKIPPVKEVDPYIAYNKCESRTCHFMLDGKISLCPAPIIRKKFNEYANNKFYYEEDIIDLYDDNLTSDKLYDLMTHPNRQCAICFEKKEWFKWSVDTDR